MNRQILVFAAIALFALLPVSMAAAAVAKATPAELVLHAKQIRARLTVPIDQSRMLRVERPFGELNVGNREVAEVQPLSNASIYILGKRIGTTNLTILDANGGVVGVIDVEVSYDVDSLRSRIAELLPTEHIRVRPSGDSIALSGVVSSADRLKAILTLAERFAPGKVANLMTLAGTQQVLIEVKFAEVERSAMKQLGISTLFQYQSGTDAVSSAVSAANALTPLGALAANGTFGNFSLKAQLDALQRQGLIRTLAEPNLVALSGDTASFLAGGEVPVPVASMPQGNTTGTNQVTLDYKKYGVGLAFTPTVVGRELVNLAIDSEVSSIDDTKSFKAGGYDIPALKVRKAKTTVELQDGQSFAIAGLLQDNFTNGTQRYPGLGDVPVLGPLFRSTSFQHDQSDLVLIITVHLVKPTTADRLASPDTSVRVPTAEEHVLTGNVENTPAAKPKTN